MQGLSQKSLRSKSKHTRDNEFVDFGRMADDSDLFLLAPRRCVVDKKTGPYRRTAQLFRLLAHPARLRILDELRWQDEACVCHLQAILKQRQPYVSQQLRVLRDAGLAQSRKDGTFVYYRLADLRLIPVLDAMLGTVGRTRRTSVCTCPACQPAIPTKGTVLKGSLNSHANRHASIGGWHAIVCKGVRAPTF
jgi:ArsR family transcriptional regulator